MFKFRFAIVGAAAALAIGTASAVAMERGAEGTNSDSHGDAVASAARTTCPHGDGHGACVSAVAQTNGEGQENNDGQQAAKVAACKASDTKEDAGEKSTKGADKTTRAAGKAEDKSEHQTFAACVSGETESASGD